MSDPRLYESDTYVVLETNQPEQLLTKAEMLEKLQAVLALHQADLPRDLQKFNTLPAQAAYLLESSCEFDVGSGEFLQWYMVRLEK